MNDVKKIKNSYPMFFSIISFYSENLIRNADLGSTYIILHLITVKSFKLGFLTFSPQNFTLDIIYYNITIILPHGVPVDHNM